eukprot:gnl/Dysnectes_brevis/553_a610_7437.p1 GENE.gnl/Dysnectes_brevis/553_a610_7437~~gnl/Dysnectes_brevis/553_a610_7437.p1  ORF type:complete len:204 (+),score=47.56 gnl/Dysnectes_brevis/553_a610_7437:52-663(+)
MPHKFANPGPIGLFGFAISTFLLNLKNAGFIESDTIIMTTGLCVGGIAQMCAGIMEFITGNQFGCVAFTCYGAFWISLVWCQEFLDGSADGPFAWYLGFWGLFTLFMTMGTFAPGMPRISRMIFISLVILFFLLALIHAILVNTSDSDLLDILHLVAGLDGIFCALCAFYDAMAGVLNSLYGREFLPLGPRMKAGAKTGKDRS